ncbi:MAG: hypothetical protein A3H69_05080 [Candidatus Sungbacteria bacterium RIFCSPLOWO2_02_FULL_47_9]|uniref:Uncharacterized protein n=1 Tax=Candidatus Sungbacteria bacterium RIFCSPHIGHO2_01_FULL_47_32 TaxID=1802264 RepID=A0A1G2K5J1_9BACT|nr:MAG: hypothetical protein UX72_C0001G0127 [Parcubacteria group bacterium GW2011_GWA2_47_10]OGZ94443.1 MAG: hypothetical protein A2633_04165 [Candidatus Sungbacteria bacterium RIFCSPHIGHO2_01_FULL_47_32]OGZ98035.1 MAG: hypothetical protein A3D57_02870 [Candidatus Sungbacteria bacterium RIFCSPHIGHO2_02_FULL_46_12]OHA05785.1 MAG: hypothetical protein A3A28_05630 [Candidatus Sungbacteria bacterium RIFCSPLOWO2_01_FULL_47_32]OHA10715.1 MAG: hypothetical protein A3H69_05080 [Candidatus Sungbacteria
MKETEPTGGSNEIEQTKKLIRLIEQDGHTKSLTVAQMALRDIAVGRIDAALLRLKVDLDKVIVSNRELYNYVLELLEKRGLRG